MTASPLYHYRATVLRVVDGDTIDLDVDYGMTVRQRHRLRLMGSTGGVDTPEPRSRDPAVRARAKAATARVTALMPVGSTILIKTHKDREDGFGRYLAEVLEIGGAAVNLGDLLLAEGLATVYVA